LARHEGFEPPAFWSVGSMKAWNIIRLRQKVGPRRTQTEKTE